MDNKAKYLKAFTGFKDLFNLKNIYVAFWSRGYGIYQYRSRPYLAVITDDDQHIDLKVADPHYKFDYAYVDEFNKSKYISASVPIQPWQIARSLFNLAQKSPIYLFMPNVDPYYCNENQYVFLNKDVQLIEFLIHVDLDVQHEC